MIDSGIGRANSRHIFIVTVDAVEGCRSIILTHVALIKIAQSLRVTRPMSADIACLAPCKTIRVCIHFGTIKIMQIFHIGTSTHAMTKMAIQTDTTRRLAANLIISDRRYHQNHSTNAKYQCCELSNRKYPYLQIYEASTNQSCSWPIPPYQVKAGRDANG
jgi:hypothetical protein